MPCSGRTTLIPLTCCPSSGIAYALGAWCFWYEVRMCVTKGHSDGKNVTASSSAFPCQNSDSFRVCTGSRLGSSFSCTMNRSSVLMQKYDTARKLIFSKIESRVSSVSTLLYAYKSCTVSGDTCIMFPMFSKNSHSF